ncbi:MAG: hypothetical protein R2778_18450 [Saprospiraceae bacterium]
MTSNPSLLIRNIGTLVQAEVSDQRSIAKGADMAQLPLLHNAWLSAKDGRITGFGPMSTCPDQADNIIDATDRMVFSLVRLPHAHRFCYNTGRGIC